MKVEKRFERYTYEPVPDAQPHEEKEAQVIHCEACGKALSKMVRYHDYYDGWKPITSTWEQLEKEINRSMSFPEGFDSWSLCISCNNRYTDNDLILFSRNVRILEALDSARRILKRDQVGVSRMQDKFRLDAQKIGMLMSYHKALVSASNDSTSDPPEKKWKWNEIQVTER